MFTDVYVTVKCVKQCRPCIPSLLHVKCIHWYPIYIHLHHIYIYIWIYRYYILLIYIYIIFVYPLSESFDFICAISVVGKGGIRSAKARGGVASISGCQRLSCTAFSCTDSLHTLDGPRSRSRGHRQRSTVRPLKDVSSDCHAWAIVLLLHPLI